MGRNKYDTRKNSVMKRISISSPEFFICRLINNAHSDPCEVVPHCSFDLYISNNQWCGASFHVAIHRTSLEKCLFRSSAHFYRNWHTTVKKKKKKKNYTFKKQNTNYKQSTESAWWCLEHLPFFLLSPNLNQGALLILFTPPPTVYTV